MFASLQNYSLISDPFLSKWSARKYENYIWKRGWSPYGMVTEVLDYSLEVSGLELLLLYFIHFQTKTFEKGIEPPYSLLLATGLIVSLLFNKVDIPLNKETKLNLCRKGKYLKTWRQRFSVICTLAFGNVIVFNG